MDGVWITLTSVLTNLITADLAECAYSYYSRYFYSRYYSYYSYYSYYYSYRYRSHGSPGVIAGAVIGAIIGVAIILSVIIICCKAKYSTPRNPVIIKPSPPKPKPNATMFHSTMNATPQNGTAPAYPPAQPFQYRPNLPPPSYASTQDPVYPPPAYNYGYS